MSDSLLVLLQLFLAHILTDFVLQPTSWVKHKRRKKAASVYLYIHAFLSGILVLFFLQEWEAWPVALVTAVSHFFIDWWKLQNKRDTLRIFLLDQFLHLLIIFLLWFYLQENLNGMIMFMREGFNSVAFLAVISAYILIIFPIGFIVGKATRRWHEDIVVNDEERGLENAGRYIGIFERILVLTFILTNNFSAIGFLIAAKSILRFNEKGESDARKQTEYVLIGTLMSFAITILTGLLVRSVAL